MVAVFVGVCGRRLPHVSRRRPPQLLAFYLIYASSRQLCDSADGIAFSSGERDDKEEVSTFRRCCVVAVVFLSQKCKNGRCKTCIFVRFPCVRVTSMMILVKNKEREMMVPRTFYFYFYVPPSINKQGLFYVTPVYS